MPFELIHPAHLLSDTAPACRQPLHWQRRAGVHAVPASADLPGLAGVPHLHYWRGGEQELHIHRDRILTLCS